MSGSAAAGSIATTLLVPQGRVARAPLPPWAEALRARLDEHRRTLRSPRRFCGEVAAVANNAALIAAHRGDAEGARALCEAQVRFHARFAHRAKDPAIAAHAVQPWVNLGRLEAMGGEWEAAVERFAHLRGQGRGGRVALGPAVCLGGRAWEALSPTPGEFARLLESIRVTDTLKALLLNRRFAEALVFARALGGAGAEEWAPLARETAVVALSRLGEHDRAREHAAAAAREAAGWTRLVFRLRLAEAAARAGDREAAAATLRKLAGVLAEVAPAAKAEPPALHVLARLCEACGEAGLEEERLALARDVYAGAAAADDEVFRMESLRVLAEVAPGEERSRWREELDRLEETTEYARLRRGGAPAPPSPATERLFAELGALLSGEKQKHPPRGCSA